MPRVSNQKAKEYVNNRKPFRGLNIFARNLRNGAYCVFSYTESWPLFLRFRDEWYGNGGWYSSTTMRHFNLLHPSDKVISLPRAVLQLFVHHCDSAGGWSTQLSQVLNLAGLIPAAAPVTAPTAAAFPVQTHLANAVVDFGAVHRRRVMPV